MKSYDLIITINRLLKWVPLSWQCVGLHYFFVHAQGSQKRDPSEITFQTIICINGTDDGGIVLYYRHQFYW